MSSKSKSGMISEADTNCEPPVKNDETTDEAKRLYARLFFPTNIISLNDAGPIPANSPPRTLSSLPSGNTLYASSTVNFESP